MKHLSRSVWTLSALVTGLFAGCTFFAPRETVLRGLTPEAARDAIRKMKAEGTFPDHDVVVELEGVQSYANRTFALGPEDGGVSPTARVIYRAGRRGATFTGARRIARADFHPVADPAVRARLQPAARDHVLCYDLRKAGITHLKPLPDLIHAWDGMEFFADGAAQTLARYPNRGWLTFSHDDVVDRGVAPDRKRGEWLFGIRGGTFRYKADDARPAAWDLAKGVWMHGFWNNDWASDSLRIAAIDPARHTITSKGIHYLGIGPSWKRAVPRRYFVYNLLEELDAPGEWYVDRAGLVLYWYPKDGAGDCSLVEHVAPLVSVRGAKYLTLEGLQLECNTGKAVDARDCTDLTLEGLDVRLITRTGVSVQGGTNALVRNCRIHHVGGLGMSVEGGDRKRLVKCNHRVTRCELYRAGRIISNGICLHVGGCGVRVDHNYLHDVPYGAMTYSGNEQRVELNEIAFAMMESGDGGGIYTGRDWTSQGNVVRWNHLHHFGASGAARKRALGEPLFCEPLAHDDSNGIYLDDCDSGDTCTGNILDKVGRGFLVGGGRDNFIRDNLIAGCTGCAASIDSRGTRRLRLGDGTNDGWDMTKKLAAVNYLKPPYSTAYPWMADYLTNDPLMPVRTAFTGNLAINCANFTGGGWDKQHGYFAKEMDFAGNVSYGPRGQRDDAIYPTNEVCAARCDFRRDSALETRVDRTPDLRTLVTDGTISKIAPKFPRIPVERIGLDGRE